MNYITQINQFYDWLDTHRMSTSSIVLYHALLHLNNKCRWIRQFQVALSVLTYKTGLSERTVRNARADLARQKLIKWNSRGGNLSATYSICFFSETYNELRNNTIEENTKDFTTNTSAVFNSNSLANNITTLYTQEETKLSIYIEGENKLLSSSVYLHLTTLLNDKDYLEVLANNKGLNSRNDVVMFLKRFAVLLTNRGDEKESLSEFKAHLANWISSQQKKTNSKFLKTINDENKFKACESDQMGFIDTISID